MNRIQAINQFPRLQRGFSLIEAMVTTGIMAIIIGGLFILTDQNQMFGRNEGDRTETIQNARSAFEQMSREIRNAGLGYPAQQAIAAASPRSLTLRGAFSKISTVATAVNAETGEIIVSSVEGFTPGQRVLLTDANSTVAAYTSITKVDPDNSALTVAITVSSDPTKMYLIPPATTATIHSFGNGTAVVAVECVTYSLTDDGKLLRSVAPEAGATAIETGELANQILNQNGSGGLTFSYFDASGTEISTSVSTATPASSLARITMVNVNLTARSRHRAFFSRQYQTVQLTTSATPRG